MRVASTYRRDILKLDSNELEDFVRDWTGAIERKYFKCERFSGPGDGGRDVVAFVTADLYDGEWHNYQCKQYAQAISLKSGVHELGKIIYNSYLGHFTLPTQYYFVAPRGVAKKFRDALFAPSKLEAALIDGWQEHCANSIVENSTIPLSPDLLKVVEAFNFAGVQRLDSDALLNEPNARKVLVDWFGEDPGQLPSDKIEVPTEVLAYELPYVTQLVDAYAERDSTRYSSHQHLPVDSVHQQHLARQRERFFHTEAFKKFYRENTPKGVLDGVEDEMYHGLVETCEKEHAGALARADAVLERAALVPITGLLFPYAKVQIKQGYCHHLANSNRLKWKI